MEVFWCKCIGTLTALAVLTAATSSVKVYRRADRGGETFKDWLTLFEMVANVYGSSGPTKLAHLLVTGLNDQARAFYSTCTSARTGHYISPQPELTKRFTPVQIPAIQTRVLHDCQQKARESVD